VYEREEKSSWRYLFKVPGPAQLQVCKQSALPALFQGTQGNGMQMNTAVR
jgi:hypothetical protein